jgi:hypothetical protein
MPTYPIIDIANQNNQTHSSCPPRVAAIVLHEIGHFLLFLRIFADLCVDIWCDSKTNPGHLLVDIYLEPHCLQPLLPLPQVAHQHLHSLLIVVERLIVSI